MSYKLIFDKKAFKEWHKLNHNIKEQFKIKLEKILNNPKIPKNKLHGFDNLYKIKLKKIGYRLAYQVIDDKLTVLVIAIGKRNKNKIYDLLNTRFIKSIKNEK